MNWNRILYPLDVLGCNLLGRRFVGAESVEGVLQTGEKLKKRGYKVTYNLLGEHVKDEETIKMAVKTTRTLIEKMNINNYGNVSCKPTLCGLCLSKELFRDVMRELVSCAYKKGIEIEIDAENYEYIPDTFEVFSYFASNKYFIKTVRQAVQAHLVNIENLMDKYKLWDKNIRIVKGSGVYQEKESIVTKNNFLVAERYLEILRRNLKNGRVPYVATVRDGQLANEAIRLADSVDGLMILQTLYGPASSGFRNKLIREGHSVSVYIPFTDEWCKDVWKPYGLRRAKMVRQILWQRLIG